MTMTLSDSYRLPKGVSFRTAAVLAEVIMVLFIIAMFTMLAMMNLSGALSRDSFRSRAYDFEKLFQMAATGAAETGRRYEIVIDFTQNSYLLRQITTGLVAVEDIQEDEIIQTGQFSNRFQLSYVMFDDGTWTNNSPALFRVGKSGWQYGGKIVVTDEDGKEYSIVINRLSRMINLVEGDTELLVPRAADEMGF
jgi:Tfp pilus assembly protein FimT